MLKERFRTCFAAPLLLLLPLYSVAQSARPAAVDAFCAEDVADASAAAEMSVRNEAEPGSAGGQALSFTTGLPVLAYNTCSGSPVETSSWGGAMFLSARHCFSSSSQNSGSPRAAYASGSALGAHDPASLALEFTLAGGQLDNIQDFAVAPVKGDISSDVPIYRLAEGLPAPGDKVTFWGYPSSGLPLFGGVSKLKSLECSYMGPLLIPSPGLKKKPFTVFHAASCPYKVFIEGMSGGPVLNSADELIGVLSMATTKPRFDVEGSILAFPEITRARLDGQSGSAALPLAPLPDGSKFYSPVYFFVRVATPADPFVAAGMAPAQKEVYRLARGNFEIPLSGGLVHGILRSYKDSGEPIDCSLYEKGLFVRMVPCGR